MFDRMNRRLYWTLVNLAKSLGIIIGGVSVALGIFATAYYSISWVGSPFPALLVVLLAILTFASYKVAAWDVDREKIQQERVERSLKKDWD